MNGRYISLILAVQIGKWTARFGTKLCAPEPGSCMQKRNVGITCADGRVSGRRRDPRSSPAASASFPVAASRFFTVARQGGWQEKGSRFLIPSESLLLFVFLNQCMLTHTSLFFPPFILSPFFPSSASPRTIAFVSAFRISPAFLSTDNLGTPVLRNPPPLPAPRGTEKYEPAQNGLREIYLESFFAENQGDKRRAPFGNLEAFPFAEQPKNTQNPSLT